MPIMKSAKKALRQSLKRKQKNTGIKRRIKEVFKEFVKLIKNNKLDEAKQKIPNLVSLIDKAAKRNIFHKNKASRKKSQIAKLLAKANK